MTDFNAHRLLPAAGAERPDFTIFDFPDAVLNDGSAEEIEFDQALSLAGRFGRDFLGILTEGILPVMATEHLTVTGADHEQDLKLSLATRTGIFVLNDPELIWMKEFRSVAAAGATDTATAMFAPHVEETVYGEPFLYVAPRLFWRCENALDFNLVADVLRARMSSVSVRLTFRLFIELLERFADVTLL